MKSPIYFVSLLLALLFSCEMQSEIDYKIKYGSDKLMVMGFVGLNDKAEVYVCKSQDPLTVKRDTIENARVSLFEDNRFIEYLSKDSFYIYRSSTIFKPMQSKSYSVMVEVTGFEPIKTNPLKMIGSVSIDSVKYVLADNNQLIVDLFFKDPPERNYYAFDFMIYTDKIVPVKSNYDTYFPKNRHVIDDLVFNGRTHKERIIIHLDDAKIVVVRLYHISQPIYLFNKSLNESDYSNGDLMTEPSVIYSNVLKNQGVFGTYAKDSVIINLNK